MMPLISPGGIPIARSIPGSARASVPGGIPKARSSCGSTDLRTFPIWPGLPPPAPGSLLMALVVWPVLSLRNIPLPIFVHVCPELSVIF
jgi:hypothetical protein